MNLLINSVFVSFITIFCPQQNDKEKITGEWICLDVIVLEDPTLKMTPDVEKRMPEATKELFAGTTFIFGADQIFHVSKSGQTTELWKEMFQTMDGKSWSLNTSTKLVKIGGRENLLGIKVHEENGVIFFDVQDIPVRLKMKKKNLRDDGEN